MINFFKIYFFLSFSLSGTFDILSESPTVYIDDLQINKPFLGGFNSPRIQWVDWDDDMENELFVLDEDGCVRIYDYIILNSLEESYFDIIDTNFGGICDLNWFQITDINNDSQLDFITQLSNSSNQVQMYQIADNELIFTATIMQNDGSFMISDPSMVPTFADIDSDGDLDFFTGNIIGTVTFYENVGLNEFGAPMFDLISFEWQDIWIVGPSLNNRHGASAIQFVDIDLD